MSKQIQDAYIVAATRTPVAKRNGMFKSVRPDDMLAHVLAAVVAKVPGLDAHEIGDVIVGCAMPEAEQGMNVARIGLLLAGFPDTIPGITNASISEFDQRYRIIEKKILGGNLNFDYRLGDATQLHQIVVNLVMNSITHGFEGMDTGHIRIVATPLDGQLTLSYSDDGRGMNAEKLRAKALEKGLINNEEANTMDERQSYNLVFLPGFSMASQISDVSGRGVGMDVVRTNIQKLNGSIDIRSSMGKGTTFIISLPLTLAIIDGMVVRVGGEQFILPTLSVVTSTRPREDDWSPRAPEAAPRPRRASRYADAYEPYEPYQPYEPPRRDSYVPPPDTHLPYSNVRYRGDVDGGDGYNDDDENRRYRRPR